MPPLKGGPVCPRSAGHANRRSLRMPPLNYVAWLDSLSMKDVGSVGGKNASLGEMISGLKHSDVKVPSGFATTADAFREFLKIHNLTDRIGQRLAALNVDDVKALADAGREIRGWIESAPFQPALEQAVRAAYAELTK